MTKRVCPTPGCPTIIDQHARRCPDCARQHERNRGSRQDRGYDKHHDRERKRWTKILAQTDVPCARCQEPINANTPWDLGHTDDRTTWTGPEHAANCNRSAAGKAAHQGGG